MDIKEFDFQKAQEIAIKEGKAVITQDGQPRFVMVDVTKKAYIELSDQEIIEAVSKRVMKRNKKAYLELAK